MSNPVELPIEEYNKLKRVLRLELGDHIAILPNDGSIWECELKGRSAIPVERTVLETESPIQLTLAQALPKGDRLETVVRMGTEIGVQHFRFFHSDRCVMRWEDRKIADRLSRLTSIATESAEQSYRAKLPTLRFIPSLNDILTSDPDAVVLSEVEDITRTLTGINRAKVTIVVGPEGGWSPRELDLIGDRGVTLGPRVLRTDTAGIVAASVLLTPIG